MKWSMKAALAAVGLGAAMASQAGVVTVWGETLAGMDLNRINSFYNGLAGHSSSLAGGTLDSVNLAGVDLLWAVQPANAYTAAELNSMTSFVAGGGRIAFMGEHGQFGAAQNNYINAALAHLGSTITINNVMIDPGFRTASVADGQILAHSLTAGVDSYEYAAFAPLTLSGTAEALMLGEALNTVMMAYQNIGAGSIFLITDQNVWDNAPAWGGSFDNARMFENLLVGDTGNNPVPEPASLALAGLGLALACASRRRKTPVEA